MTLIETKWGKVALIFVGAFLVGSIQFHFPIRGNLKPNEPFVEKGGEIGYFQFGSTVILMTEKNRLKLIPLRVGQELRLGEPILSAIQ